MEPNAGETMADSNLTDRLTEAERRRYSRHLVIPEVGIQGQSRLKGCQRRREILVLVVGCR